MAILYTIGHSTHTTDRLIEMLRTHGISAVADVRSAPYSRFNPQFNREVLQGQLREAGIEYVFLGAMLGARPKEQSYIIDGRVDFEALAAGPTFRKGVDLLMQGMESYRVSLLCAEKDPVACHRMILVCRAVRDRVGVRHILEDGDIENGDDSEARLMQAVGVADNDLFMDREALVQKAYSLQARRIAYVGDTHE